MDKQVLKAEKRKITGRKVKNLRKEGILPANIYGKKIKSLAVAVDAAEFKKVYDQAGETGLLEVQVDGEKRPVLIHNLQKDPVSDTPVHIDFLQVDLKQKVSAKVPLELSGEAPAEKQSLGTVVQYIKEVEVEALPGDLPERFVLDISKLDEVDKAIYAKDLKVEKGKVELKLDPETILVKVEPPQKEEEIVPPPVEGEVAPEAAPEGEVPAEGGAEAPQAEAGTPATEEPKK